MGDGKFLKQPKQAKKRETKKVNEKLTPERIVVTGPDTGHMPSSSMQHDINHVAGLDGVEQSLDWIARSLSHLTSDEHAVGVVLGQNRYAGPVKITFADNDEEERWTAWSPRLSVLRTLWRGWAGYPARV